MNKQNYNLIPIEAIRQNNEELKAFLKKEDEDLLKKYDGNRFEILKESK